jgi:hypothetical protein
VLVGIPRERRKHDDTQQRKAHPKYPAMIPLVISLVPSIDALYRGTVDVDKKKS